MAEGTAISWATHTFNPWWGCRQVSPGCNFCYAKAWDKRYGGANWGATTGRRMLSDKYWNEPLKWNRAAEASGEQVRVFCASMADVFEDHPALPEPRARLWNLIERTPALTWMLLTKRPENVADMVPWDDSWPGNVWLGVSAETQKFADQRIPILLQHRAVVRFVSAAPLLEHVDVSDYLWVQCGSCRGEGVISVGGDVDYCYDCDQGSNPGVTWVITEGESGPKARPSHPAWFRSLRDQCADAEVAFHHKQNGEYVSPGEIDTAGMDDVAWNESGITMWPDGRKVAGSLSGTAGDGSQMLWRVGLKRAGRLLDGQLHDAHPIGRTAVAP